MVTHYPALAKATGAKKPQTDGRGFLAASRGVFSTVWEAYLGMMYVSNACPERVYGRSLQSIMIVIVQRKTDLLILLKGMHVK